ncbi:MAG: serine hydrolase [Alphaproteobacteria bacterium]|nr:serine hydrolase [Alphaproteobacteria bacterium]
MRTFLAALLTLLLLPALARADDWQTSSPEAQGMSSRELADLVSFGISNGMDSLLVTRHGKIVAEAYYAPFAPGLRHRVNSTTKSVIGNLVAIALKEGLIKSLDQPVLDFFPERHFANVDERKKAITLRHLLDMTSGLDWDEPMSSSRFPSIVELERNPDWVQFILDRPMVRDPGATFEYNSGGPHLLSAILSKVTGRSALDYAKEKLFKPLGIEDVQWRADPQGVSIGGFGLYFLPRDMAKLGMLWLHDGVWNGQRLLPAGWIDEVRHAKVEMPFPGWRYANLFWSVPDKDAFMSVGFDRQLITVMPGLDVAAVFTGANRYNNAAGVPTMPTYRLSAVLDRLKAAVKSDTALPEDPAALALLADKTKEVAQEVHSQSAGSSPLAAAISGKVYRLQPNPLRLSFFALTFANGAASYTFDVKDQHYGGPIGLDGLYDVGGRRPYGKSAAKGRWLDDKTFQLESLTLGNDDASIITFTFGGRSLTARLESLGGFKAELKGEAGE